MDDLLPGKKRVPWTEGVATVCELEMSAIAGANLGCTDVSGEIRATNERNKRNEKECHYCGGGDSFHDVISKLFWVIQMGLQTVFSRTSESINYLKYDEPIVQGRLFEFTPIYFFLFYKPAYDVLVFLVKERLEEEEEMLYGAGSGWVEAQASCDHLNSLSSDLSHIPTPNTPCSRCDHPAENWLCLCCKDILCSRFVNKHMLQHFQERNHSLALSYSDLSVWCFSCDAYLDVQAIWQLRPVYEIAHLLKFGEAPPFRTIECLQVSCNQAES
ncbi:hypothetical protein IFM89_016723 [Coptis chinensis]|uniref:UBP-type domain-containing protein n=1 Tax=Coptis chinensis TaxID=261450 RepID=A0A835IPP7_9MAGN|nr:hypothetical protein IFM89_016723 [Coptis chinensis]